MRAQKTRYTVQKTVLLGLLFALAIALSLLEGALPAFIAIPGIKLGLSNIVIMFCLYAAGGREALCLAALKSLFVLFVRGAVAASLSFAGGILSIALMSLTLRYASQNPSAAGIAGAISHNLGQLMLASVILRLPAVFLYYLPVLIASGVVMGLMTSALLKAVRPLIKNSSLKMGAMQNS